MPWRSTGVSAWQRFLVRTFHAATDAAVGAGVPIWTDWVYDAGHTPFGDSPGGQCGDVRCGPWGQKLGG